MLVTDVYPGSAAARAGLRPEDVILDVDGQGVNDEAGLDYLVGTHSPGDKLTLDVRHGGQVRKLAVTAEPPPATPPRDERTIAGRNPLGGATVVNLSPATAQELGVDPFAAQGVMVTAIADGGLAGNVGVRPGDVIRAVNGQQIHSTGELQSALAASGRTWRITIQRGDQQITGSFSL